MSLCSLKGPQETYGKTYVKIYEKTHQEAYRKAVCISCFPEIPAGFKLISPLFPTAYYVADGILNDDGELEVLLPFHRPPPQAGKIQF